ncbi:MAG: FAD-dependent oxidoreductase [Deltaproteobacteria bacterium]|nr:FAD-dependent oxidoreductase [Deltaproteobacteria bacterium]
MNVKKFHVISGKQHGNRIESRILEEKIQDAVALGHRRFEIIAYGQHGIGGRLWTAGDEAVYMKIKGHSGQRLGSFGFPNTIIENMGPVSDDVGWLNAGAEILIHGNAANGTANGMAQGKVLVNGNIGARGMTMTKHNPRFDPPELWVMGSVGDYFGEFMAGGTAVICGLDAQNPDNVLGYRPLVGMVGGRVFFRGPHSGYSRADAKSVTISDTDFDWLIQNLHQFLKRIGRPKLMEQLSTRKEWTLLTARTFQDKFSRPLRSVESFRAQVWERELGRGGIIGDLTDLDRSPVPLITSGKLRRFVPVWENRKYSAPCEASCPTGIPVQERWRLIREGRMDEAMDMALEYTPFPATVCGYLCPGLCMQACTRQSDLMAPIDTTLLGKANIEARLPDLPAPDNKKIAVIGGGPAGISIAWQLRLAGHQATVYDRAETLGGKMAAVIPKSRIPANVLEAELQRTAQVVDHVQLQKKLKPGDLQQLKKKFAFIIIAVGAQKPRTLPLPGDRHLVTALDFLSQSRANSIRPGKQVVIIGAGNVGCDVATEAFRLGAEKVTLIDVQEPLSFGEERDAAEALGAVFKWPCFVDKITENGVILKNGEVIDADTTVISIGDIPDLDFLPPEVAVDNGFIRINEYFQTTDPAIFAVGDAVKPGLLTDAIGAGRKAAGAIINILSDRPPLAKSRPMIDRGRVATQYFDPRVTAFEDLDQCGSQCSSCGTCRDCMICVAACPQAAISRIENQNDDFEYVVDADRCIGCGFCTGACPCGIWNLVENEPLE